MSSGKHCITPLAAVAGGLLAGAVGTVCPLGLARQHRHALELRSGLGGAVRDRVRITAQPAPRVRPLALH